MTTINEVELATNLAELATEDQLVFKDRLFEDVEDLYIESDEDTLVYTEAAQDCFNEWYDFYWEMIFDCKESD